MNDFLSSVVMREALGPATLIAMVASSMSVMVLAHRLAFLAVGVSHATLAGLGIAVALSLPLLPTAAASAVIIALLLGVVASHRGMNEDAATGVLFAGAMALGIVLLSTAGRHEVDLFGLLFGNILMVSDDDRFWLLCGSFVVFAALIVAARPWWSMAFDDISMRAMGLPVRSYRLLLHAVLGLTVVMCVKLAGIVLTAGLLVLPAASAWLWGRSLLSIWTLSLFLSLVGTWLGLYASYLFDWPSGATVVLLLCGVFLISRSAHWLLHHSKAGQHH